MPTKRKRGSDDAKRATLPTLTRTRDRRETEASLFAAGVRVMSSLGYDAATTKRIAEVAGVNEQLISRYFGGKEGLLLAIMDNYKSSEFVRELATRPRAAATVQGEILAFLSEADFSAQRESFARLALGRAVIDPDVAQAIHNLCTSCYRPLLAERLKAHQARGAIDPAVDISSVIDALIYVRLGLAAYGRMLFRVGSVRLNRLCRVYAEVFAQTLAGAARVKSPKNKRLSRQSKRT